MTDRTISFGTTDVELFREALRSSARGDGAQPRTFADLIVRAAEDKVWTRLTDGSGRPFPSFRAFMEAPEPYGLGMNRERFLHAMALADKRELGERLLYEETREVSSHGGDRRSEEFQVYAINLKTAPSERPDSADYVVARLKRDAPELAERVISGEISPNAAARQMGWRRPRIIVSTPERTAAHLRKYMTPDQLAELARLLLEGVA